MNTVYTLSPKGQRECAAEHPMLLRELHDLLRMVDGRRTRADLLATVGKNAITMDPAPKHARAVAVAVWVMAIPDCTSTTVLTITIALPAAMARFSASRPRNLGVAR